MDFLVGFTAIVVIGSGIITGDSSSGTTGILVGNPRSMKISLLAADSRFSTFTE
jgi:hypothetical protein